MANTYIKFSGKDGDWILAEEEIDAIHSRWMQSGGQPFEVKSAKGTRAFVNPARIACVRESKERTRHASFS